MLTRRLADEYGDSEELVGKWLAANPEKAEDIFLATKFGIQLVVEDGSPKLKIDSSPEYCRQALERSLSRLSRPSVDLYYIHRLDKVTPIEKTMEAMVELKNNGKIKYIGISECSADSLRRAHAVHPITAVQVEYSAFCRDIELPHIRLLETARELGVAIVAYSPTGNGILTGGLRTPEDFSKPGDLRSILPWLQEGNFEKNLAIVDSIGEIAKTKGITVAQLALAWVLAQGNDVFALMGTKRVQYLRENLSSVSVSLSPDEEKRIRQLSDGVVGGRVQDLSGYAFGDTPPLHK